MLVERDMARIGRRIDPDPGNPAGEIHNVQWASMAAEAAGIAGYVKSQIEAGTEPGEVLVLTSSRPVGQGIRDAMRALNIPTVSYFREEPVQSRNAQEALTLLTLLVDPADRVALRVWLGFGSGDFRRGGYLRVLQEAQRHGQDRHTLPRARSMRRVMVRRRQRPHPTSPFGRRNVSVALGLCRFRGFRSIGRGPLAVDHHGPAVAETLDPHLTSDDRSGANARR
jgi:hypothetical protein